MEQVYTKEVVDLKLQAILERCNDILIVATEGRDHARLTNGRVTKLENHDENRKGAMRILTYIGIPAITLLIGYLSWLGVQVTSLTNTLASYDIEIQK